MALVRQVRLLGGSYDGLVVELEPARRFLRLTAPGGTHDWYETYSLAQLSRPAQDNCPLMYCIDRRA